MILMIGIVTIMMIVWWKAIVGERRETGATWERGTREGRGMDTGGIRDPYALMGREGERGDMGAHRGTHGVRSRSCF